MIKAKDQHLMIILVLLRILLLTRNKTKVSFLIEERQKQDAQVQRIKISLLQISKRLINYI